MDKPKFLKEKMIEPIEDIMYRFTPLMVIFIFDIAILIGGCINDVKFEYKGERYYG